MGLTKPQILKRIVVKAIDNGYPQDPSFNQWNWKYVYENGGYLEIIFSHDFAKAFWGNEQYEKNFYGRNGIGTIMLAAWEVHLQQMVLEKDYIKYLKKFL